jgi:hypothetical protein
LQAETGGTAFSKAEPNHALLTPRHGQPRRRRERSSGQSLVYRKLEPRGYASSVPSTPYPAATASSRREDSPFRSWCRKSRDRATNAHDHGSHNKGRSDNEGFGSTGAPADEGKNLSPRPYLPAKRTCVVHPTRLRCSWRGIFCHPARSRNFCPLNAAVRMLTRTGGPWQQNESATKR